MAMRSHPRGFSLLEASAAVSLLLCLAAIAVPTFLREVRSSRLVEPVAGLEAIGVGAVAYAAAHTGNALTLAFPPSVGLTPSSPPHGRLAADPPGTWYDPTWGLLDFPKPGTGLAFADGVPHGFAFAFDSNLGVSKSTFVAHAHADLDGDGAMSTFEIHGYDTAAEGAVVAPGMYVESELE
jgi:type II secretory pathway pseudopilin PulG